MLTERSLYILQKLIYTGKVYKISAFAHHFDVSVRSIQYDLNRISDFLADYSFPALERPTGSSISYHLEASQEERLLELLRNTTYQIILSPHQRQLFLLLRLLSHDGFVTMDYLSQQLLVSRATVLTDLDKIRSLLPAFEIVLDSRTRRGIRLSAKERNLRELAISLTVPSPNDTSSEEFSYDSSIDCTCGKIFSKSKKAIMRMWRNGIFTRSRTFVDWLRSNQPFSPKQPSGQY